MGGRGYLVHGNHLGAEENDGIAFFWAKNLTPRAWGEPTSAVDLVPTVLDALGLPPDPDHSGLVVGTAPIDRPILGASISRLGTGPSCATAGGWKLGFAWATGALTLYDRGADPIEAVDRYDPAEPHTVALWPALRDAATAASAANPAYPIQWPDPEPGG